MKSQLENRINQPSCCIVDLGHQNRAWVLPRSKVAESKNYLAEWTKSADRFGSSDDPCQMNSFNWISTSQESGAEAKLSFSRQYSN
jgi:Uri superfamily endonuclease